MSDTPTPPELAPDGGLRSTAIVRKFFDLPLGTRFRYPGSKTVWVSLERHGCGKIAKWTDVDQWHVMQPICSVAESEEECRTIEVELVDLPNADIRQAGPDASK